MLLPIQPTNHLNYTQWSHRLCDESDFVLIFIESEVKQLPECFFSIPYSSYRRNICEYLRWNEKTKLLKCSVFFARNFRHQEKNICPPDFEKGLNDDKTMDTFDQYFLFMFVIPMGQLTFGISKFDGWHGQNSIMTSYLANKCPCKFCGNSFTCRIIISMHKAKSNHRFFYVLPHSHLFLKNFF